MIMKKRGGLREKISKDHSSKNWSYASVKRLLRCFKHSGTMYRKEGSGRLRSVTTKENTNLTEELIFHKKKFRTNT